MTTIQKRPAQPAANDGAIRRVDELAREYSLAALEAKGPVERAILLARGVQQVREALNPLMADVMALMNTRLGFLTDRDPRRGGQGHPYTAEEVRDCAVEALLRGLRLCGNEWNIIAGGQYTTLEGYRRLVRELPGLTDLEVAFGVPQVRDGGALVRVRVRWRLNGKADELRDEKGESGRTFAIRLNRGMGADAILGKAERKALKAVYHRVTGTEHSDGEVGEAVEALPRPGRLDALAEKLQAGAAPPVVEPGELLYDRSESQDPEEREERVAIDAGEGGAANG